jgi:hypothetical protein
LEDAPDDCGGADAEGVQGQEGETGGSKKGTRLQVLQRNAAREQAARARAEAARERSAREQLTARGQPVTMAAPEDQFADLLKLQEGFDSFIIAAAGRRGTAGVPQAVSSLQVDVSGLPFSLAPGDLDTFYRMLERVRDVVRPWVTDSFYGPEEDMAHTHVVTGLAENYMRIVVTGPAANYMHIALDEASPSNGNTFRIHSTLLAFLRAYLPLSTAEEWRASW